MLRLPLLLLLVLFVLLRSGVTPAEAQQGRVVDLVGRTLEIVRRIAPAEIERPRARPPLDILRRVLDLESHTSGLERRLEDLGGSTRLVETAEEIRVRLSGDILFDFDSAAIRPTAIPALRELARLIRTHPGTQVRVEGHTDAKGSDAYNQKLSERRARSVRDWFVEKAGIAAHRLHAVGYGESRPVAPNTRPDGSDDPEGRQRNRRVEVVIEKG